MKTFVIALKHQIIKIYVYLRLSGDLRSADNKSAKDFENSNFAKIILIDAVIGTDRNIPVILHMKPQNV